MKTTLWKLFLLASLILSTAACSRPAGVEVVVESPPAAVIVESSSFQGDGEANTPTLPPPTAVFTNTPFPTQTPLPSSTATLVPTDTPTLIPPTFTPTPTASFTPTPEPQGMKPGMYFRSGCEEFSLTPRILIEFCVVDIEVTRKGNMIVQVSWMATFYGSYEQPTKRSDEGTKNMVLIDNLGNRYIPIGVAGDAARAVRMGRGTIYYGYFIYAPAKPGADTFTFHDSDQNVRIPGLVLAEPDVERGFWDFETTPLMSMAYWKPEWIYAPDGDERVGLNHMKIQGCRVEEWDTSTIEGKLKNTITIGATTYQIYGWSDTENNRNIREYVVEKGPGDTDLPLAFRVWIPNENANQCIMDASTLLGTLNKTDK